MRKTWPRVRLAAEREKKGEFLLLKRLFGGLIHYLKWRPDPTAARDPIWVSSIPCLLKTGELPQILGSEGGF